MPNYLLNKIIYFFSLPFALLLGLHPFELAVFILAPNKAYFLYAQASFETGKFKDYKFRDHKNPWGMRIPTKKNKVSYEINGYAGYKSYYDAVYDYLLYVYVRYGGRTAELFEKLSEFPESVNDDFPTWASYIYRLKLNNYYTTTYENYLNGVWSHRWAYPNNFIRIFIARACGLFMVFSVFFIVVRLALYLFKVWVKK